MANKQRGIREPFAPLPCGSAPDGRRLACGHAAVAQTGAVWVAAVWQCSKRERFGPPPCGSGPNGRRMGRSRAAVVQTGAVCLAAMRKRVKTEPFGTLFMRNLLKMNRLRFEPLTGTDLH